MRDPSGPSAARNDPRAPRRPPRGPFERSRPPTRMPPSLQSLVAAPGARSEGPAHWDAASRLEVRAWRQLSPQGDVYSPRTGHTVSSTDGRLYVFGGTDRRRRQQDLYQFDIESNAWSQVQAQGPLPPRRSGALGVMHESRMFLFGGYDGRDGNYFNDLFYFNFEKHQWDEMPSVPEQRPEARTDHIMVLHQASIYIFGGYNGSSRFNDLCEYSLQDKRWKRIDAGGSVPSRRFGHSGVVHAASNRLIVFGGWDGRDTLNDLYEYNFLTREWRKMNTRGVSPPHRYRHTAVISGDNMFVFGGVDKTHSRFNDLQRLDLVTNTWSEVCTTGSVPSSRTFHRAVVVGTQMYLLGGYDGTDRLQDLYSIDIGPQSPPSLTDICADYVRTNMDALLEKTTFKGVPQDLIDYVVFKRDTEGALRGKCKLCRPGKCCVYRIQQSDGSIRTACDCGHSNFHHELIEDSRLYGKKSVDSASSKVIMLCGSIYKRLFDSTSSTSSTAILFSPRSGCSDSSTSEKECVA